MYRLYTGVATCMFLMCAAAVVQSEDWGGALSFDGDDDLALISAFLSAPTGNAPYTQELWVKALEWRLVSNGVDEYNGFIFSRGGEGPLAGSHMVLMYHNAGLTHWGIDTDTGYPIELDRWYHMASTWDGATESLYINGTLAWSQTFGPLSIAGGSLTLGRHDNVSQHFFCGQVDEVRVWDYARSAQQIDADYLRKVDPNSSGLVGYWQFDKNEGQTIMDSSPYANHGHLGATDQPELSDPRRICSGLPLNGDIATDSRVDGEDLAVLISCWLSDQCGIAQTCCRSDLDGNGWIDLKDFAGLAQHWLRKNE